MTTATANPELCAVHDSLHAELQALSATGRLHFEQPMDTTAQLLSNAPKSAVEWARLAWYGPLEPWLSDAAVSDLLLDGPAQELVIVRDGALLSTGQPVHASWLTWLQGQLVLRSGALEPDGLDRWLTNVSAPLALLTGAVDRRLRFALTRPPVSPAGPTAAVRVLPRRWWQLDDLVRLEVMPRAAAELLVAALRAGVSVLVGGLTGSGKTTLAAALLTAIAAERRVVVIEDSGELPVPALGVALETGACGPTFADLVRFSLRQRPDYIVIGEVRGAEALAMLQAASTGHPGISTIHSSDAQSAVANVALRAAEAGDVAAQQVRALLTAPSAPLIVCQMARVVGQRRLVEVAEVLELGNSTAIGTRFPLNPLWNWDAHDATLRRCFPVQRSWGAGQW